MMEFDESATYSSATLADLTGFAQTTISYYVRIGVLAPVPFRGGATRYTAEHLLRLLALRRLNPHKVGIAEAKRIMSKASREKLFALAGLSMPTPKEAPVSGPYRGRRQHVCHVINLAPGVDLHVSAAADAEAQRVASEIVERYGR